MQKRKFNLFPITFLGILIISIILLSKGCTDDPVVTSESKIRTLTVIATVEDCDETGVCIEPASNATFELFEVKQNERVSIGTFVADKNGNAVFKKEFPAIGINAMVIAKFNNMVLQSKVFLHCADTTLTFCFDCEPMINACCDDIDVKKFERVFKDLNGQSNIVIGDKKAEDITINILCNGCEDEDMYVTLPEFSTPFYLKSILIDGIQQDNDQKTITLHPEECLAIVVGMHTDKVGEYKADLKLIISCEGGGGSGDDISWDLSLTGTVIEEDCGCPVETGKDTVRISYTDIIKIGESSGDLRQLIFTNDFDCDLIIDSLFIRENGNYFEYGTEPNMSPHHWEITNLSGLPGQKITVSKAEKFRIDYLFKPEQPCVCKDTFLLKFTAQTDTCNVVIIFTGEGCEDLCPLITSPTNGEQTMGGPTIIEEFSIPFSPGEDCKGVRTIVFERLSFSLENVECSCFENLQATVEVTDNNDGSLGLFTVSPMSFNIPDDGTINLNAMFTSPTQAEFKDLGRDENNNSFTITIKITFPGHTGCTQEIELTAIVVNLAKLSEPLKLFAYNQETSLKPTPDFQVCDIEFWTSTNPAEIVSLRDINMQGPTLPLDPFIIGDTCNFFVNVDNPSTSAKPPQSPKLYLIEESRCADYIKLITRAYGEENFDQINPIQNLLNNAIPPGGAENYFYNSSDIYQPFDYPGDGLGNLQVGDVYAIYSAGFDSDTGIPCCIALIYITQVLDGTEATSNKRSGIDYRVLAPIVPIP